MMRAALILLMGFALAACGGGGSPGHERSSAHMAAAARDAVPDSPTSSGEVAGAQAGTTSPTSATRLGALRREGLPSGFAVAAEPMKFEFPRDHGPHPAFRHEWWYVTGHLDAATGEHFGFELTFFRFALAPPTGSVDRGGATGPESESTTARQAGHSAWRSRQIYMAHFAVTDLDRQQFHSTARYERDALGLSGAQASPFRVWLDDWSLGIPPGEAGPEGTSSWHLHAADEDYTFDLYLRPVTPPVLNGDAGLSRKSSAPGAASYYYSMPRLAAFGRVVRGGKPLDVDGLAWLDRVWGSGSLGPDQQGWDWFALQLDDGGTLMFYALRKLDGRRDAHSAGTWLAPDGTAHALASDQVHIEVKDHWTSPRGGRYPARWQLRVPSLALDVDIRPRLANQELDTTPRYWEGAATVAGTRAGQPVAGRAYVELVGYAGGRE
jgi:predicted secreted hydrolase